MPMMSTIVKVDEIQRVAVLGAGTMGHGIAQVAAQAGWQVVVRDVQQSLVDAALARIAANLAKGVEKGKLAADEATRTIARLSGATSLEAAVRGAQLVIEAIPENMQLK